MSETTKKLRAFQTYSVGAGGVRDLAADAIEAVEAQVAEAVARVAALEEMGRLGASPNGDDRTRGGMPPRGFDSPTPAAPTPPAPSAVPAPRGFRVGDKVVIREGADCDPHWFGKRGEVVQIHEGAFCPYGVKLPAPSGKMTEISWDGNDLVRAADAPEAPAEDDGLVERLAKVANETAIPGSKWPDSFGPRNAVESSRVGIRAILATLRADQRLCAPGEVARLTDELAEANGARFLNANAVRLQKARAEAAEKERDTLRAKLAAAEQALDVERRTSLRRNHGESVIRRVTFPSIAAREDELRRGSLAHETVRAERDALRAELDEAKKWRDEFKRIGQAAEAELATLKAKPRFRTRRITREDAMEFMRHDGNAFASLRALGFRRRVDGAK